MLPTQVTWKTISQAGPALLLLLATACSSEISMPQGPGLDPDADAACQSNRDFFAHKAWPKVFGKTCLACHGPDGVAVEEGASFRLLPAIYPGFIDANLESIAENALNQWDGVSMLLAKPAGLTMHGGGVLVHEGDADYQIIEELIARLAEGEPCEPGEPEPDYDTALMASPEHTFRKATLALAGRLPTEGEEERLAEKGEVALEKLLDKLMTEDAFYERLKEIYNDVFLTDKYYGGSDAVRLLDREQYPRVNDWFDAESDEVREAINRALAREPLELIAHIVRSERPFSEILTADYTVVNPFSAQLYNVNVEFDRPNDEDEWREAKVRIVTEEGRVGLPHAGLLTNPMWLNRFPSSTTNRNRHRARQVMSQFLATDILRVAERPIDPATAVAYNNPTRDDPSCTSCHRQIDPIAGAFMKWDDEDPEQFVPLREWYRDMFAPGFGDELMPTSEYDRAQRWLGRRVVRDPRFALSVVRQMFSALTGHTALEYPAEGSEGYADAVAAWEAQERAFRAMTDAFVASDYNLKVAIRNVILSPYFRTEGLSEEPYEEDIPKLSQMGTARLSTPEQLDRKVLATTGMRWARDWDRAPYLRGDYAILYGGIDSDLVITRLTDVNSIMTGVQWRMANEVPCAIAPFDFSRKKSERTLFKFVSIDDTPIAADGSDDDDAIERIQKNIAYLEDRFWGTSPAQDDPEVIAAYELFEQTWREGLQGVASGEVSGRLSWQCSARSNPLTGEELPEARRLSDDPRYTVRAWMAVLTYLMADYQFLFE